MLESNQNLNLIERRSVFKWTFFQITSPQSSYFVWIQALIINWSQNPFANIMVVVSLKLHHSFLIHKPQLRLDCPTKINGVIKKVGKKLIYLVLISFGSVIWEASAPSSTDNWSTNELTTRKTRCRPLMLRWRGIENRLFLKDNKGCQLCLSMIPTGNSNLDMAAVEPPQAAMPALLLLSRLWNGVEGKSYDNFMNATAAELIKRIEVELAPHGLLLLISPHFLIFSFFTFLLN